MKNIISASRRTDIPAFYTEWFMNRLKAGEVIVQQPFSGKFSRVSLKPEDVGVIVFSSKNYAPLIPRLDIVEKTTKNLFFHFTITGNAELELSVPNYRDAIKDYVFLADHYSPEQLVWRFDPICITDKLPFELYEERFEKCAELLQGRTKSCFISFANPYKRTIDNLKRYAGQIMLDPEVKEKQDHASRLAKKAEKHGIRLFACCNDYLVSWDVGKAKCIDGRFLSSLFNIPLETKRGASRKECACTKSFDIGAYDTCAHGCLYCYANVDKNKAVANQEKHNPEWNALHRHVEESLITQVNSVKSASK